MHESARKEFTSTRSTYLVHKQSKSWTSSIDYSTSKAQARNLLLRLIFSGNASLYHNISVLHIIPFLSHFLIYTRQWTFPSFKTIGERAQACTETFKDFFLLASTQKKPQTKTHTHPQMQEKKTKTKQEKLQELQDGCQPLPFCQCKNQFHGEWQL